MKSRFEWDEEKNNENIRKHGISFAEAQYAFLDPNRVIAKDLEHSQVENRYFIFGKVKGGVLTVRFTYRTGKIRIIGAGFWRKGKVFYETQNQI
ncbi:MAG: BrnT family toxin [Patescibacteria group bacterium]